MEYRPSESETFAAGQRLPLRSSRKSFQAVVLQWRHVTLHGLEIDTPALPKSPTVCQCRLPAKSSFFFLRHPMRHSFDQHFKGGESTKCKGTRGHYHVCTALTALMGHVVDVVNQGDGQFNPLPLFHLHSSHRSQAVNLQMQRNVRVIVNE